MPALLRPGRMPVEKTPLVVGQVPPAGAEPEDSWNLERALKSRAAPIDALDEASMHVTAKLKENPKGSSVHLAGCTGVCAVICLVIYYANGGEDAECSTPLARFFFVNGYAGLAIAILKGCVGGYFGGPDRVAVSRNADALYEPAEKSPR